MAHPLYIGLNPAGNPTHAWQHNPPPPTNALGAHANVTWNGKPLAALTEWELRAALAQALTHIKRLEGFAP